jgi:putative transposase
MAKRKREYEPLATIWEVDDDLWAVVQGVLDELDPPAATGRPRVCQRAALNGIVYQMRTGAQWNQLPARFGDDSGVHRTMQRWVARGVLERVWAVLVEGCADLGGIDWRWQSADGSTGKARFGGTRPARTPRTAGNAARNAA